MKWNDEHNLILIVLSSPYTDCSNCFQPDTNKPTDVVECVLFQISCLHQFYTQHKD